MDILVIWLLVLATCAQMALCAVLVSKVHIFLNLNESLGTMIEQAELVQKAMIEEITAAITEKAMADSVDEKSAARH